MSDTLEQAIAAIRAGDKNTGRQLLNQVLQTDPRNETAWLWMTAVVGSDEERRKILEYVLSINPDNETARNSLAKLKPLASPATGVQVDSPREQQAEISLQPAHKAEESEAVKKCPYCVETIKAEAVGCRFCGRELQTGQSSPATVTINQSTVSISPLLVERIREMTYSGWYVIHLSPTEVHLGKPKKFGMTLYLITVLILHLLSIPGSTGHYYSGYTYGNFYQGYYYCNCYNEYISNLILISIFVFFIGTIVYFLRWDRTVFYTEEKLRKEEEKKHKKPQQKLNY